MSNDHSAFFGDSEEEAVAGSIPADLIPYLEAADEPDEVALTDVTDHGQDAEEAELQTALRNLVESSLLLGPDPSILAELEGDIDEDFADDAEAARAEHEEALAKAADSVELDATVAQIYESIVERAPEHDIEPSLDRIRMLLDILGDPQNTFPTVHITGTNGKTSTARMIDAVLTAFGVRVGRFTSPHLIDVRERISIEGIPISREAFIAAWNDIAPYVEMVDTKSVAAGGVRLSFFEVFTALALAAFADHPVDAGVIEVGMGGTWDATNLIEAGVSVIMPIDLDHTKWLGSTIREIAEEKAGIIKPGQIVVIAEQPEEALEVLLDRAREVDAIVRLEGRDFELLDRQMGVGGQLVTVRTPSATYTDVFVPLFGEHQAHNAAAALVGVEAFMGGRALDAKIVENGMMTATSPGRLQVVRTSPTILVDAAHNPAGARVLADALDDSFAFAHVVGVYSAMGDKDIESVLAEMEPHLDSIVITEMPGERAANIQQLREIAIDVFGEDRVEVRDNLGEAVDRAATLAEVTTDPADKCGVVVFGSVVLAGHMLDLAGIRP
ncbi:folylpolyglutamate synthase/dihydrofolate synthase family protein [Pauljensenia sp. UMB6358]|uniref:bifunctional folylpolyglutamate synthase/dihydrofolate synthase n=1 Tax=unclassified Pauljensenia TaxID=2908895 RepID=UPI000ABD503D|nr:MULTISPECIES: folylpolyglutamate synthase/dihydrofolate synthase family protein [unclassified Pauljensenia]MDK7122087.1 folylpolyglutamate synthase/dihydrofolate synthase family protein [Pauljensenia sp. UMB6358]MDK7230713.1 folylpolyglutamate synthase/dihydrofolate synthase family protein [Pauljensenia sp. UMB1177]MDK7338522.1 folylpolyglutamate synthase/dihydrofolate synthase family protein [Pauljensenia sp. UMB0895]